jgi:large subunit ribosomal protein L4
MALVKVVNIKNQAAGEIDLADSVFKTEVSTAIIHQAIVTQLAGRRRGTASTKTKAEVRGGGRKPFKQKGTGNARQGSSRSPLSPGGGESFGPKPRSYFKAFPKKMAQAALRSALSDKLGSERLIVIDDFKIGAKTKEVAAVLNTFKLGKALMVDSGNKNLEFASRNLRTHKFLRTEGVNVFDVVNYEWLVLSKVAAQTLSDRLSGETKTKTRKQMVVKNPPKAKVAKAKKPKKSAESSEKAEG